MQPKLKKIHDTLFRGGWCAIWLTSAVFMMTNFVAYEENTRGENAIGFAMRATGFAMITIIALCMHAYLIDHKRAEKNDE
jgi:hypothetical protein